MISYTKRYVNIVSLLITILVYFILTSSFSICNKVDFEPLYISNMFKRNKVLVELNSNNINQDTKENIPNNQFIIKESQQNWKIVIPKISLEAEISEGTSKEIMDKYVGHFQETSSSFGNIGLAAHNRGYEVNYFSDIKKLRNGDEIIYKYYDFEKTYIVDKNIIIKDINWDYLEPTEENKITLITCVENEPEYRRCIQAENYKIKKIYININIFNSKYFNII